MRIISLSPLNIQISNFSGYLFQTRKICLCEFQSMFHISHLSMFLKRFIFGVSVKLYRQIFPLFRQKVILYWIVVSSLIVIRAAIMAGEEIILKNKKNRNGWRCSCYLYVKVLHPVCTRNCSYILIKYPWQLLWWLVRKNGWRNILQQLFVH